MTAVTPPASPDTTQEDGRVARLDANARARLILSRYWLLLFLILEIVVFSILRPSTFFTSANFQSVTLEQVVPLVAALALMLPLIVGEFDFSVGTVATGSAVLAAGLMGGGNFPTVITLILAVLFGSAVGLIVALLVARFEVNSFVGTLGVATVIGGFIDEYTGGLAINKNLSPWLVNLAEKQILGVPTLVVAAVVLALLAWFVLTQTVYGRQLSALGANRRAAQLLGLRARLLMMSTFVLSGTLAAVAGLLQLSTVNGADPTSGGFPLVVTAITAVYLGATCFRPGHFNVGGTIVGLLFVAFGISGLSLLGLEAWVQDVFTGVALVVALTLASAFRRAAA